jgi:hypothetical protein
MEPESVIVSAPINKGGRPKGAKTKSVSPVVALQSPEVQKVIAEAVAKATAEQPDDMSTMRKLALAIGEVADQGSNRKRISPEVMERRRLARDLMEELILNCRAQDIVPEYELSRAVYLSEELVPPTYTDRDHILRHTKIEWAGVPSEGMTPTNDAAKKIFTAFMDSIGGATPLVNRPIEKSADRSSSGLKVLHRSDVNEAPQVAKPRNAGVTKLGRRQSGDVIETHVLGTNAEPARQIA